MCRVGVLVFGVWCLVIGAWLSLCDGCCAMFGASRLCRALLSCVLLTGVVLSCVLLSCALCVVRFVCMYCLSVFGGCSLRVAICVFVVAAYLLVVVWSLLVVVVGVCVLSCIVVVRYLMCLFRIYCASYDAVARLVVVCCLMYIGCYVLFVYCC